MFVSRSLCVYSLLLVTFPCSDQQTSVTTIPLFDNNLQVRYLIRHVRYFIHKQLQMPPLFIQKYFVIWPRLACQQTTALLNEFPGFFMLKSLAQTQVELRDDLITSCGHLRFALTFSTYCGFLRLIFLRFELLLADKLQFHFFLPLCVLAAQERLVPLLAPALFLGCTVPSHSSILTCKANQVM